MSNEFVLPEVNRVHIAWADALLKATSGMDLEFSLPENVDRIFTNLDASGKKKVAIYVHGGLVSGESEFGNLPFHKNPENKILFDALNAKEVYPIYFVWETGIKESIRSAATDWGEELADDPIAFLKGHMAELAKTFLFKRILKYLPKTLAAKARAGGLGLVEPPQLQDVEIEENRDKLSFYEPAVVDYDEFDDQDKQDFLEKLSADEEFMEYLRELGGGNGMGLAPHPDVETLNQNAGELMTLIQDDVGGLASATEPVSLVERPGVGLVDVVVLKNVGEFLGKLVFAVGARFVRKEDHGFVATISEEFFRLVKLNHLGILIWNQMKENARKAYLAEEVNGVPHGGYYVIRQLAEYIKKHPDTEVSLIGHSAGSIHLSYFIESVDALFGHSDNPTVRDYKFGNLIFLAPAVNFETFQKVVTHKNRFERFHIFTMQDADEMQDALLAGFSKNDKVDAFLKCIYPCSLLYAVSGLAEEKDKGDVPILGLARHLDPTVYRGNDALVHDTWKTINAWPTNINWSRNLKLQGLLEADIQKAAHAGKFTASLKHGDFDNEPWTAVSVASLL